LESNHAKISQILAKDTKSTQGKSPMFLPTLDHVKSSQHVTHTSRNTWELFLAIFTRFLMRKIEHIELTKDKNIFTYFSSQH
jgi:hypothetical protein